MASAEASVLPRDVVVGPRPDSGRSDVTLSEYNFEWLFDPHCIDHLPIEEQLKYYKQRDLKKTKVFKVASKIWGGPASRKRKIVAAPMHSNESDAMSYRVTIKSPVMTSELKPQCPPVKEPSLEEIRDREEREKVEQYQDWVKKRQGFRHELESMGLDESWLANKPDKTALEKRVLMRMIAERNPRQPTPPPLSVTPLEAILPDEVPVVRRPSPLAIRIIEKFLRKTKMRLIDLFQAFDKDKDWKVSRDEFRKAIYEANIPISETLLEDLILALDSDLNNELDYRELAKGMGLWKIEKRESKQKMASSSENSSPTKYSQISGFEPPEPDEEYEQMRENQSKQSFTKSISNGGSVSSPEKTSQFEGEGRKGAATSAVRLKSALSTISTGSGSLLEVPDDDLREEQMVYSDEGMVDTRKRDREALNIYNESRKSNGISKKRTPVQLQHEATYSSQNGKMVVLTGDPAVDGHSKPSTLAGETGELVDKFRQLKLKEFSDISKLCQEKNVPFTENLLKKVLLFPRDRSHTVLQRRIRQPAQPLLSNKFAEPQSKKQSKTPVSEKSKSNIKGTSHSRLISTGHLSYPTSKKRHAKQTKMHLSTGKAMISRQVNCWLTFEEYERLTSNMATDYRALHGPTDDNAFWPGRLLDKLRLCFDEMPPTTKTGRGAMFMSTRQNRRTNIGYNNDLNTWPTASGYVQYGNIDK